MSFVLLILVIIFIGGPIAKAYADRISRELPAGSDPGRAEIGRLREEVERLALEVSRLQDEQSFMVKLLEEGERKRLGQGPKPEG
jgi:hypothetical protein